MDGMEQTTLTSTYDAVSGILHTFARESSESIVGSHVEPRGGDAKSRFRSECDRQLLPGTARESEDDLVVFNVHAPTYCLA